MINIIYSDLYKTQAAKAIRVSEPLGFLSRNSQFNIISIQDVKKKHTQGNHFLIDNQDFQNADILFLFITDINPQSIGEISPMLNYFHQKRKIVVTTIDDHYFHIPDNISNKKELQENVEIFKQVVSASHLVLTTGKVLQEEITKFNPRVVVVPNMIDLDKYSVQTGSNRRLHIGWSGLQSHFEDLSLIIPALIKIKKTYPVDITLFGLFNHDIQELSKQTKKVLDKSPNISDVLKKGQFVDEGLKMIFQLNKLDYRHIPAVPYPLFTETFSKLNLDIGLCPLKDTLFNNCKSAIKFAQYAASNVVTIASDVYPYNTECNYLAKNNWENWYEKIAALVESEVLRKRILKEQHLYIMNNRNYEKGIILYEKLFKAILSR